jgi:hypothetical protein
VSPGLDGPQRERAVDLPHAVRAAEDPSDPPGTLLILGELPGRMFVPLDME